MKLLGTSGRRSAIFGVAVGIAMVVGAASPAHADRVHMDDFAANTLADYEARVLPDSGIGTSLGNTVGLEYDAAAERAVMRLQGGYATAVMTTRTDSLVASNRDFSFSVDATILREFSASLYLGDLDSGATSTYLIFIFDNYLGNSIQCYGYENGVRTESTVIDPTANIGNSGSLEMRRTGSEVALFLNGDLMCEVNNSAFSDAALHYGVAGRITSGAAGVTALTGFDNWNFQAVPEPGTSFLVGCTLLGGWALRRRRVRAI